MKERLVSALKAAVIDGPAETSPSLRRSAFEGAPVDPRVAPFLAKVRTQPHRVEQSDLDQLSASGFSEDAIFELTVASALGEGVRRLRHALRLLSGGR